MRIAVCVNEHGDAGAYTLGTDETIDGVVFEGLGESYDTRYIVTADLPLPRVQEVAGRVEPVTE